VSRRRAIVAGLAAGVVVAVVLAIVLPKDDTSEPGAVASARALALDTGPDGHAYALVERTKDGVRRAAVSRAEDDGALDPRPIDLPVGDASGLAVAAGNSLIVAGTRLVDGTRQVAVGRVGPDGRPDPSFGANGAVTVRAGDGDAIARGIATSPAGSTAVVVADASQDERHAMAVVHIDVGTGRSSVDLIDDASAGGVAAAGDDAFLVAGTDPRNGDVVLARLGAEREPQVTRAKADLSSATWRAIAPTPDGGAVVVGSGREPQLRSLVSFVRFSPALEEADRGTVAVGEGDAYGQAVQVDRSGRILVAANGSQDDAPAAYLLTLDGERKPRRKAAGRVAGLTPDGGLLTTRWDGERQSVAFNP
jgi:hypothetical protein